MKHSSVIFADAMAIETGVCVSNENGLLFNESHERKEKQEEEKRVQQHNQRAVNMLCKLFSQKKRKKESVFYFIK